MRFELLKVIDFTLVKFLCKKGIIAYIYELALIIKDTINMTDSESNYEITECICSWYDLLGYGQPLMEADWNLKDKRCEDQLKRVKLLDLTHVNKFSSTHHTTSFTLNDGIVLNFDINSKLKYFKNQLIMVLDDLLMEYEGLNYRDVENGYPGVRGIIT